MLNLLSWAKNAARGDLVVYHSGYLAPAVERPKTEADINARSIAKQALRLSKAGDVHLVQRRAENGFDYIAVRR